MNIPTDGPARPHPEILLPQTLDARTQRLLADFCEDIRRRHPECLGFIPDSSYRTAQERDRLIVNLENGDPCGFVLWARRRHNLRIHQCAIVEDARRVAHATHLVTTALTRPAAMGATTLKLRVAEDLEANAFWQSIGAKVVGQQRGGKKWRRMINIYRMDIRDKLALATRLIEANLKRAKLGVANGE